MAEAISGKKLVYLFRVNENDGTDEGECLAFTTENSRTTEVSADSVATKSGSIRVPGVATSEITATSLLTKGDTRIRSYEKAMVEGKLFDIWEANLEEPVPPETGTTPTGKFYGTYWQGYLTSFEKNSNSEDFVECSFTFGLNGNGEDGEVTVDEEQQEIASYVFVDTGVQNAGGDGVD